MGAPLFENVQSDPLLLFFLQLALTLALTRVLGKLFSFVHQPTVVGEIIAGVLLGPSVLGRIPGFTSAVWPTAVPMGPHGQPYDSTITFGVVADVGVVLFMFMLGCELDHHRIRQQWKKSLPIALSAIIFPFGVGAALSLWLEDINKEGQPADWTPPKFRSFMLFLGASMSFTAFPVLASLLTTMGLLQAPIGVRVLSCAAVDDVMAWCVLALASSFAQSSSALQGLWTCLGTLAYVLAMLLFVRPALAFVHARLLRRNLTGSPYYVCSVFLLLIASAFTTQGLGVHCFFGSFVMGMVTPKEGGFAEGLAERLELVVVEIMLPLFFASSGVKTDVGTLDSARYWLITLALVGVACFAKFTPGCLVGKALLRDRDWRFCAALGILMNTRGLVEIIALNIGLTMGILSIRMFSMLLLMALATTCLTTPAITLLYRGRRSELAGEQLTHAAEEAQQAAAAAAAAAAAGPPHLTRRTQRSVTFLYRTGGVYGEAARAASAAASSAGGACADAEGAPATATPLHSVVVGAAPGGAAAAALANAAPAAGKDVYEGSKPSHGD